MSKKLFVGSLPNGIDELTLKGEFSKFGPVESVYVKQGCEQGRQWAFVTYGSHAEAQNAKDQTDRKLTFPGHDRPCDVTLAKNQGMFGQDPIVPRPVDPMAAAQAAQAAAYGGMMGMPGMPASSSQQRKIFVGSLPDSITEDVLRAEFTKYGVITDFYLKTGCEPGRQWAFITYQSAEQANFAKSSADRTLVLPGAERACEVMIAKNQGKNGSDPVQAVGAASAIFAQNQLYAAAAGGFAPQMHMGLPGFGAPLPPPPIQWQTYYTTAGMPYYHNASTGVTQWEAPPEMGGPVGVPAMQMPAAVYAPPAAQPAPMYALPAPQPAMGYAAPAAQPAMGYAAQPAAGYAVPAAAPFALPAPAPAAGLPAGWTEHLDSAGSGQLYFHNASTGVTTWERPEAMPAGAYGAAVQPAAAAPGPY